MSYKELDIGIDLDGVCYDFTNSLRHYLIEHEGASPNVLVGGDHTDWENATWEFYKDCWGMTLDEFLWACDRGTDAGVVFLHGEPFEGAVETLNQFKEYGHRIHLITNRSFGTRAHHNTSDWLTRHDVPFDSLVFTPHKWIFRPDIMLDDYEKNFNDFWEVGVPTILFRRPWNQHVETPYQTRDWEGFAGWVHAMAVERGAK